MTKSADAFRLDGKHALVTGGASGIGEAACKELARAGAIVAVADISLEKAQALAQAIPGASAIPMDVTQLKSIEAAVAQMKQLDILVNNAGIAHVGDIAHVEPDDFDHLMEVNVKSVYLVTRAFLPLLLASRGSIVNIGSVAGLVGIKQRFAYCATKGAVIAMTRQLAVDYPKELRVNCICPGTVHTPFVEGYLEKYHAHEKDKVRAELDARQPMGRMGKPEEIAAMIRYICSNEAEFMTGSLLTIDGGWTAA
jgi:2-keto-3-deoxy-L-fuconate dehydrogenase